MNKKVVSISKDIEIDYENGFKCSYTVTDDEVSNVNFEKKYGLEYIKNTSNFRFEELMYPEFSEEELENFTEFDKLYIVNEYGRLLCSDGEKYISTLIHCKRTKKNRSQYENFMLSLNQEYICNVKIVTVYDCYHIYFDILLPENLFNDIMKNNNGSITDYNLGIEALKLINNS